LGSGVPLADKATPSVKKEGKERKNLDWVKRPQWESSPARFCFLIGLGQEAVFFLRGTGGGEPPTGNALKLKAKCLNVQERKIGKQNQKTKLVGV
jgi:hypothetical protein